MKPALTRRHFLLESYIGLGGLALVDLLAADAARADTDRVNPSAGRPPHLEA
jgi:hypothetical protein